MIQSYRDLKVYTRSYEIAKEMYFSVKKFPREEQFGLISQIKRAATSIPLNIAEGYGKKASEKEFKRFLLMALGSCNEMNVLLDFSKDFGYLEAAIYERYSNEYNEIGKMLNVLINKWNSNI